MPHRYKETPVSTPFIKLRPFSALREKFTEGYTFQDLRSDLLAGIVVAMVAIPLGMALGIASGVAPQYGLYTVIVGGAVVALFGGSRCQVSGPTAAFVVILAPISAKFGFAGLLVAGLMAGVLLIFMGLARMGQLIQFIPHPVTTGFTAGIAVVITTLQLKDFFGLHVEHMPETYLSRVQTLFSARATWTPSELAVGAATLAILLFWPKVTRRLPAPLVALSVVTVGTVILKRWYPELEIATIGSRFSSEVNGVIVRGIPQIPPQFGLPWNLAGANGRPFVLDLEMVKALIPPAFAIAMLGAIESLLSAVVADGMAQTHHDPDTELIALGTGNILCPFFGGIAATGAIARTATNIRFGARSPIAAITHAAFTLVVVLLFAPYVSRLPMAALAALLILVAYNISEVKHFRHIIKIAPRSDVLVLLLCFSLTIVFDMVVGVTVGIVLAALLFMRRMATVTSGRALLGQGRHAELKEPLPKEIMLYEIAGPLFFGAADRAIHALNEINSEVRVVIFDLEDVPTMDVTGLVALESAIGLLTTRGRLAILSGVRPQPAQIILKSGLVDSPDKARLCHTLDEAIQQAKQALLAGFGAPSATPPADPESSN